MPTLNDDKIRHILETVRDLAPESYVVGGAVRDILTLGSLGTDLDVAVKGDGYDIARRVAERIGSACSFVPLDAGRGTARLVFREPGLPVIDVSSLKAASIGADLLRRDFTVNAIAIPAQDFPAMDSDRLIDPCQGLADLRRKTIRVCSQDSFADDPLRILRAFRFAAALGFAIDSLAMRMIPRFLPGLASVAGERIRDELFAILSAPRAFPILQQMDAVGIMDALFPEFVPMKGCVQNDYHHLDVWDHSLEAVGALEGFLVGDTERLGSCQPLLETYAGKELVMGRPRRALLKLAALWHDSGKPRTRFVDDRGKVRFFGHEEESREIFERAATRLKLAAREIHVAASWIQGHMRPIVLFDQPVSRRAIYRLWKKFGEEIMGLFLLFLGDLAATRGPARPNGLEQEVCARVCDGLAMAWELEKTPPKPLINGRDLMEVFGLTPGPKLGEILRHLAEMQASAEITNREEALAAAQRFI
jgi:poly(A) polymerase